MQKNEDKDVKAMLDNGFSPADVLKSIAEEEDGERRDRNATRRLATKDLSFQEPAIKAGMKKPAIKVVDVP